MDVLFLIGRILVGGYFIMSGIMHFTKSDMLGQMARGRGLGAAKELTILSGIVILLGGLGVLLGVFVGWAVALLVIFLVLTAFLIHHFWSDNEPNERMQQRIHFMTNLALAGAILMFLTISQPWPLSLGF